MRSKLIIIITIVVVAVGTVLFWKGQLKNKLLRRPEQNVAQDVPAINGLPVNQQVASTRPLAVVIENHTDARPQSGLYFADIIYETLAEGGISRYLALFQTQSPKEIGPVRSARPYFNFLANEWGGVYAHVGGSTQALSELDAGVHTKLIDLNQYFFGDYFYRSKDRPAPHNAYTSDALLRDLITKKHWRQWDARRLGDFETIPTEQLTTNVTKITVKFFDPNYTGLFDFDPTTGLYNRSTGGKPATDKINNTQLAPRNVLIQFVDDYVVPMQPANGLGLHLDEDGRALLFTGGKVTQGNWRYKDGFTEYLTTDDKSQSTTMKFQPGQTWIILMPKSLTNNVTWQ